jgi:hypothetical protein
LFQAGVVWKYVFGRILFQHPAAVEMNGGIRSVESAVYIMLAIFPWGARRIAEKRDGRALFMTPKMCNTCGLSALRYFVFG